LLLLSLGLPAQSNLDYRLAPRQMAEGTWLLEGSTDNFAKANGGNVVNTAFILTGEGVVVIDSGPSRRYGEALRRAIATVTDKPVLEVLLTHHHPDHVLGNQAFTDVPIGALAGTAAFLREQGDAMAENMYGMVGDWMRGSEVVLPTRVVEPGVREVGGHRLRLLGLRGHTGADLAIRDETTGVLFAGDLLFYQRALTTPNSP
ncbi:MBL fold metallo-hydrolase, partial [Pseudomonas urethralis]|uniref:MBL fold metallo-hydrolase n=1 Tax=Pseudomonas urethralis TaxID=2740517 RepID=UPI002006FB3E